MPKPHVSAEALASLSALVPPRITKRLDANPRAAEGWVGAEASEGWIVATDGEDRVTLRGATIASIEQVSCSCLLSPRCFHALAVLSLLPLAEGVPPVEATTAVAAGAADAADAHEMPGVPSLSPEQRKAASRALGVAEQIIVAGLANVSTARLGELLRAVHEARRQSLPRLERALLGVVDDVRRLRERHPEFTLPEAADALARLWLVASLLARGETSHGESSLVGTARRAYHERRGLRLSGLGTEPILAAGYAGVVSRFTDGREVFSALELWPGDDDRAAAALSAQLRFGEISLTHRDTLTTTLLFSVARISGDGRLGAGQDVVAARAPLDEAPRETFLARPLAAQIGKTLSYHPLAEDESEGLVIVTGRFVDSARPALLGASGVLIGLDPAIDHPRFAFRENLSLLARAHADARVVCKLRFVGASLRLVPLSVFPAKDGPRTIAHGFDLGFERRARADLPTGDAPAIDHRARDAAESPDPLGALRARVHRWALGGTGTLPSAALPFVVDEASALERALLPTVAAVLTRLATAAADRRAETSGEAWVSALFALRAAERTMARTDLSAEPSPVC